MNVETPNWRTELYNKYYGSEENNKDLSADESALLKKCRRVEKWISGWIWMAVMRMKIKANIRSHLLI